MLNPTYDIKQLKKRQTTIEWMIKKMNDKKYYTKLFRSIYTVEAIVFRFQKNKIEEDDWRKLIKSLENMIDLRDSIPLENPP